MVEKFIPAKNLILKELWGEQYLDSMASIIDGYAKNTVVKLTRKGRVEDIHSVAGEFLMSTIISVVFGFDITAYPENFEKIRSHFRGIAEPSVKLSFDMGFQFVPWFLKGIYAYHHYSGLYKMSDDMSSDIDWLLEKSRQLGVLDDETKPDGKMVRSIYKRAKGVMTDEHKGDLIIPTTAGSDTGALFLKAVVSELGRDRERQKELRDEIISLLQTKTISPDKYGFCCVG